MWEQTRLTSIVRINQVTTTSGLKRNGTLLCCGGFEKTCPSNNKPRPRSQRRSVNRERARYITCTVGRDSGRTSRKSFSTTNDKRSAVDTESTTAGRKEAHVSRRDVRVGRWRLIESLLRFWESFPSRARPELEDRLLFFTPLECLSSSRIC